MSVNVRPQHPRLVVAFDVDNMQACNALADRLDPTLCRAKVGKELFTACGPSVVEALQSRGFDVFLDLKFHDIPATVAKAVKSAAALGVWMVNVHASGGARMLEAAADALSHSQHRPLLIGVTLLTSLSEAEVAEVYGDVSVPKKVLHFADSVRQAGLDGVVCSAQEAATLRENLGRNFVLVTPGIRPANAAGDDQRRIMTPEAAVHAGSHYLVVGRPVTQAADPAAICQSLSVAIASAESSEQKGGRGSV